MGHDLVAERGHLILGLRQTISHGVTSVQISVGHKLIISTMVRYISSLLQYPSRRLILIFVLSLTSIFLLFLTRSRASGFFSILRIDQPTNFSQNLSSQIIQNATLGFERIFAINLPERTDHRDGLILATAVSNIEVEFVDGVRGDQIQTKALPPNFNANLNTGSLGAWRAHINAIRRVVETGVSTALILEDDVDWDVRLRDILDNFATAARSLNNLSTSDKVPFSDLPPVEIHGSPYGNDWDVLWLGHCGMELPEPGGLVIMEGDETVPEVRYLRSFEVTAPSPLRSYPQHTRIFSKVGDATCSLAYAVSQKGARALLNDLGLNRLAGPFDNALRDWCTGSRAESGAHVCFGVLPQLFDHYRREGATDGDSDISLPSVKYREKAQTLNIRWSVRMNMHKILKGETDYDDQWPDS